MFVDIPIDHSRNFRTKTTELSFILKASSRKGVGVFTTHAIKSGTKLRLFPLPESRLISHRRKNRDRLLNIFCQRYGIEKPEGVYAANDFGCMEIGWYLNHSKKPNAGHDSKYNYFALRNILPGEEITIDYYAL